MEKLVHSSSVNSAVAAAVLLFKNKAFCSLGFFSSRPPLGLVAPAFDHFKPDASTRGPEGGATDTRAKCGTVARGRWRPLQKDFCLSKGTASLGSGSTASHGASSACSSAQALSGTTCPASETAMEPTSGAPYGGLLLLLRRERRLPGLREPDRPLLMTERSVLSGELYRPSSPLRLRRKKSQFGHASQSLLTGSAHSSHGAQRAIAPAISFCESASVLDMRANVEMRDGELPSSPVRGIAGPLSVVAWRACRLWPLVTLLVTRHGHAKEDERRGERARFEAMGLFSKWKRGARCAVFWALESVPEELWARGVVCPAEWAVMLGATSKRVRALLARMQRRVPAVVRVVGVTSMDKVVGGLGGLHGWCQVVRLDLKRG